MTDETFAEDVGRRLAAARLRRGFSQVGVARRANLTASYLSRVETGKVVGVLGVIGPTRLNYGRIIPMVDYTAQVVGRLLT